MNVYFPIKNFDANTKLFFGCIQLNVHSFGFSGKSGVKFGVSCKFELKWTLVAVTNQDRLMILPFSKYTNTTGNWDAYLSK